LRVDVTELTSEPGARMSVEGRAEVGALPDGKPVGPALVRGELVNTGSALVLSGTVDLDVRLRCSRCLEDFQARIEAPLEGEFRRTSAQPGEDERRRALEDEGVILYYGSEVDLSEPVRESLVLAMPMRPLCDPDCRGLCPRCGTNLNRQACGCDDEVPDPRLADLGRLLDDQGRPEER